MINTNTITWAIAIIAVFGFFATQLWADPPLLVMIFVICALGLGVGWLLAEIGK